MGLNHRYIARLATDIALWLFVIFAVAAFLWLADEFLDWNLLPDWIDRYAQLIVILFAVAGSVAVGMSLLCSFSLLAQAAAQRAGFPETRNPGRGLWVLALLVALILGAFFLFQKLDQHRKQARTEQQTAEERVRYDEAVRTLRTEAREIAGLFPAELVQALNASNVGSHEAELIRFLSAAKSSAPHGPEVFVVTRAEPPYRYCRYHLVETPRERAPASTVPFELRKQHYFSFPTSEESEAVERLFADGSVRVEGRVRGEVLDTVRAGAWAPLLLEGKVAGLLVFRVEHNPAFDFQHPAE